jgi:cytochrome P450
MQALSRRSPGGEEGSDGLSFNPLDIETRWNPYSIYAQARREHPVYRHPEVPIVSVFRYRDIEAILKDPQTWSNDIRIPGVDPDDLPAPSMLGQDPPEHTRLRALVSQAFTPRIIRRLEPRMRELTDDLLDRALEERDVDFVAALAHPLPVIVISEMIGVPTADREQFKLWSNVAVEGLGTGLFVPPTPERIKIMQDLLRTMDEYFHALAEERRREPREDLLTGLVHAEVEGSKLSRDEVLRMLVLLLVAGNETTTTLIGDMVLELLAHRDELGRLREDPSLVISAVDEVMRYASPVQMDPRGALRDLELGGVPIEKGQLIVCWLGSANHDETVFDDPERFDVGRPGNHHLGFGFGPHYCLGANLARLEASIALERLLARTKSFERTGEDVLPLHPSIVFRGVTRLPLRLVAA